MLRSGEDGGCSLCSHGCAGTDPRVGGTGGSATSLGCASSAPRSSVDGQKESPVCMDWAGRDVGISKHSKGTWPGGMLPGEPRCNLPHPGRLLLLKSCCGGTRHQGSSEHPAHPSASTAHHLEDTKRRRGERKEPVVKTSQSLAGKLSPRKM